MLLTDRVFSSLRKLLINRKSIPFGELAIAYLREYFLFPFFPSDRELGTVLGHWTQQLEEGKESIHHMQSLNLCPVSLRYLQRRETTAA